MTNRLDNIFGCSAWSVRDVMDGCWLGVKCNSIDFLPKKPILRKIHKQKNAMLFPRTWKLIFINKYLSYRALTGMDLSYHHKSNHIETSIPIGPWEVCVRDLMSISVKNVYVWYVAVRMVHTVTASLSSDSPNTTMYNISLTWISSNTAKTATGSTAAISDEKRNMSNSLILSPKIPKRLQAYKEEPAKRIKENWFLFCLHYLLFCLSQQQPCHLYIWMKRNTRKKGFETHQL